MSDPKYTWIDLTSYTQSEPRGAAPPHSVVFEYFGLRLVVTKRVHCGDNYYSQVPGQAGYTNLGTADLEAAKNIAVCRLQGLAEKIERMARLAREASGQ